MITGPRMSRKDLELSELEHFENTPGAPSSVLFLSQAAIEFLRRGAPKVAFRDLAPEHLAVAVDGRLVLADFGDARAIESLSHTLCGTAEYVAPEMARGVGHDDNSRIEDVIDEMIAQNARDVIAIGGHALRLRVRAALVWLAAQGHVTFDSAAEVVRAIHNVA